jgi:hypothetical protein
MACFMILLQHMAEGTEESHDKISDLEFLDMTPGVLLTTPDCEISLPYADA